MHMGRKGNVAACAALSRSVEQEEIPPLLDFTEKNNEYCHCKQVNSMLFYLYCFANRIAYYGKTKEGFT